MTNPTDHDGNILPAAVAAYVRPGPFDAAPPGPFTQPAARMDALEAALSDVVTGDYDRRI